MEDVFRIAGSTAIVWGGGLGMGEQSAIWLARAGCNVAVADIDPDAAERVVARIRGLGCRAVALVANVTDEQDVDQAVAEAEAALGPLTIMVTVVGMSGFRPVIDTTVEQWDREHAINLKSVFLTSRAVARVMVRAGRSGAITAICSVSGLSSAPNHAAYGAAKAGVAHLVRSLAVELGPNIRVNAVAPGTIETLRVQQTPERVAVIERRVPAKRFGTTEEIGKSVLFLSSDLASFVTGQTLAVDGGWMAQFLLDSSAEATPTDVSIDWKAVARV